MNCKYYIDLFGEKILALDTVYVTVYEHFKKHVHLNMVLQMRSLEKITVNRKLMICWQNMRTALIYQRYSRGLWEKEKNEKDSEKTPASS